MPNPILATLQDEITQTRTVIASAITLISGIQSRIQAAVAAALENGASAADLAPLTELEQALEADRTALADAVVANTPGS